MQFETGTETETFQSCFSSHLDGRELFVEWWSEKQIKERRKWWRRRTCSRGGTLPLLYQQPRDLYGEYDVSIVGRVLLQKFSYRSSVEAYIRIMSYTRHDHDLFLYI